MAESVSLAAQGKTQPGTKWIGLRE
jgi:hypothetical protein